MWKVEFHDQIEDDKNAVGLCINDEKRILIKYTNPRYQMSTFIHEVLHAIEYELELKVSHKAIYGFEEGLLQVLLDNF